MKKNTSFFLYFLFLCVTATLPILAIDKLNILTDTSLVIEDRTKSEGYPKTGIYVKGHLDTTAGHFYIGFPPTTSYSTNSTPPVILTGQESDKSLLVFSLNGQNMTAFRSVFDGKNNALNQLSIDSRGTSVITLTGKGYIGIGTQTPTGFFHVQGNMYVNGLLYAIPKISDTAADGTPLGVSFVSGNARTIQVQFSNLDHSASSYLGITTPYNFQFPTTTAASVKSFVIQHPLDKQRYLVHSALEGPENGVRYRGKVQLAKGKATISLPDYVAAFTDPQTATLHLFAEKTGESVRPIYKKGKWIKNGIISIESEDKSSTETVTWTVQLTRTDIPPLVITPPKNLVHVDGFGPYKALRTSL